MYFIENKFMAAANALIHFDIEVITRCIMYKVGSVSNRTSQGV